MAEKKISILHYGISAHLGGIETYSFKLARNFDMNKYHFDFLYLGEKKPCFYDEMSELGCGFIGITSRRDNYLRYLRELDSVFRKNKWDIVHLHLNSLNNISPVMMALKYGNRVIVHSRNGGMPESILNTMIYKINFTRLKQCKIRRIAVSDLAGEWMFGKGTEFDVINNGIDVKKWSYSPEARKRIREKLGLNDSRVIIHTGSFKSQKNHDFLIDIFKCVHDQDSNYKLLLAGTGELMKTIQEKVCEYGLEEDVFFLGQVKNISDILSAGDFFLFPSLYEGFPNALIEAETSGLSCLVSDTITNNVLFPGCNKMSLGAYPSEWAKCLLSMGLNRNREESVSTAVKLKLDVQSEIKHLEELYSSILLE